MDLVEMEAVITVVFKTLVSKILNHSKTVMSDLGTSVNIVYLAYLKPCPFSVLFWLLLPWKKTYENCIFCRFEILRYRTAALNCRRDYQFFEN